MSTRPLQLALITAYSNAVVAHVAYCLEFHATNAREESDVGVRLVFSSILFLKAAISGCVTHLE